MNNSNPLKYFHIFLDFLNIYTRRCFDQFKSDQEDSYMKKYEFDPLAMYLNQISSSFWKNYICLIRDSCHLFNRKSFLVGPGAYICGVYFCGSDEIALEACSNL